MEVVGVNVHVGCMSGNVGVEVWQDFLECVGVVDSDQVDNPPVSRVQSLSSSQVCSFCVTPVSHSVS